jgi:hypothetical protein
LRFVITIITTQPAIPPASPDLKTYSRLCSFFLSILKASVFTGVATACNELVDCIKKEKRERKLIKGTTDNPAFYDKKREKEGCPIQSHDKSEK